MVASFVPRAIELRGGGVTDGLSSLDILGRLLLMARVGSRLEQRTVSREVLITTHTISQVERGLVVPNPRTVRDLVLYYEAKGVRFYDDERAVSLPANMSSSEVAG